MNVTQNESVSLYKNHLSVLAGTNAPGAGDAELDNLLASWAAMECIDEETGEAAWLKGLVFIERVSVAYSADESGLNFQAAKAAHDRLRPTSLMVALS